MLEQLVAMKAPIIGIGLDSAEVGHPASEFTDVYARAAERAAPGRARRRGGRARLRGRPWTLLGVQRVDHGVQSVRDHTLVQRLVVDRIPLTVCPLSNVRLRVFESLADHVLPQLLAAGVVTTINSDDPAYFGTRRRQLRGRCRPARPGPGRPGPARAPLGRGELPAAGTQGRARPRDRRLAGRAGLLT